MNYIDKLFAKYSESVETMFNSHIVVDGENFKLALTEALEKQREDLYDALMLIIEQPIPIQTLLFQVQRLFENYKLEEL